MSVEIRIPEVVWQTVLDLFQSHEPGVERVAYLDGFRVDEAGYPDSPAGDQILVATTVVVPNAVLSPRNYNVPARAISDAGLHLRTGRMRRVAQVHSHGNDWVEHSATDDEHAYSQRAGAISVVVPFHGTGRPALAYCGVHVRTDAGWQRVRPDAVITIIPSVLDHRRTPWTPTANPARTTGIFSRFLAWVSSLTAHPSRSESSSM